MGGAQSFCIATVCKLQHRHNFLNAGFFGKLNKVIFPSQPKTHLFGIVDSVVKTELKSFSSNSCADDFRNPNEARALTLTLLL